MGSFTTNTSTNIMKAFFNETAQATGGAAAAGKLVSAATIATTQNYVIYHHSTSNVLGIYSASSASTNIVRHRVDLISGGSAILALNDANFPTNGNTFAASGTNVGFANYGGYQGMSQRTDGLNTNSHSWTNWTVGTGTGSGGNTPWNASNAQQIGFPMATSAQSNGTNIVGFCLSAGGSSITLGTAAAVDGLSGLPVSTTVLLPSTPTAQVIFAYGDLSSARPVGTNDTPVFTQNAIVISLE